MIGSPSVGYFMAKLLGKIRRDRHKETLNKWFMKRGVKLVGYPEIFETSQNNSGGVLNYGRIYAAI